MQVGEIGEAEGIAYVASPEPSGPAVAAPAHWLGGAPSQTVVVTGTETQLHLGFWVDAPAELPKGPRAPLDLSLVVDGSGSMAGEKIENAHLAATSLLESLARSDIVSIYSFSDGVTEIAPPTVVSPSTIGPLIERVREIQALGSTNLFGGLRMGESRVAAAPRTHPVRRVIVISDGQANVGPSSPEELGNLAAQGTEAGVQVSAIGIGLDYDERTLGALALRSSGRLYHLEEPSQMAAILDQEVRLLSATAATGAYIEIQPAEGVEIVGAEFVEGRRTGSALRIAIGSLYAGQHREVLVRVKVRGGAAREQDLATARLFYEDRTGRPEWRVQTIALRGAVSEDRGAAEKSAEPRVSAMLARHQAAEAERRAAEMLNVGQSQEAAEVLAQAEMDLSKAAGAMPIATERDRLASQAVQIGRIKENARKATTREQAKATAKEGYGYSFADDGLAAPPSSLRPGR